MTNHAEPSAQIQPLPPPRDVLLAGLRLAPCGVLVAVEQEHAKVITWTNPVLDRLLGLGGGQATGLELTGLAVRPVEPSSATADVRDLDALITQAGGTSEVSLRREDGTTRLVRVQGSRVDDRRLPFWVVTVEEIDEQVRSDVRLRESEERLSALAAQAPIGIFVSEVGLRLGFVNERALQLWDRPLEVMQSPEWLEAIYPEDRERVITALASVLSGGETDVPLRISTSSGEPRSLRLRAAPVRIDGRGAGFIGSLEDTTAQVRHEEALRHAALHDPLTGLPNRAHLDQVLEHTIDGRRESDGAAALLFFDLDDFKRINDGLGHAVGDSVLVEVAARLSAALRGNDVLARFGGDEFVVLCRGIPDVKVAMAVAERMRARLDVPFVVGGRTLDMGASVGVAVLEPSDDRPQELLRNADAAMYLAKQRGRGRVVLFKDEADRTTTDRVELLGDLRRAISDQEIGIEWQPILRLSDQSVSAVEVSLRWDHPIRGTVAAAEVLRMAATHDLVTTLGRHVLEQACGQLASWREAHPDTAPRRLCVSMTNEALHPGLPAIVAGTLARTGIRGSDLVLELPEEMLTERSATARAVVDELASLGVTVAVDDFGAGRSSLAALVSAEVDMIRLDERLIARLIDGQHGRLLVRTIIDLAAGLGVDVVADGITTPAQLAELVELGCSHGQGPLLAGRMSAAEFQQTFLDLG